MKLIILMLIIYSTNIFTNQKLEKINLYLKWRHQFQFAGYYAAQKNGYYKDEGLEVNFIEGNGYQKDKIKKIISKSGNYGIEIQRLLLDKENRDNIKILSVIFQHSPIVAYTLKNSKITRPQQFIDKKILGNSLSIEVKAMLIKEGIDYKRIKYVNRIESGYGKFISSEVDIILGYITSLGYRLKSQGVSFNIIKPSDYGVDFYGDFIFTSNKEIDKHPERVEKFLRASLKGWNYAMDNKIEIIKYMIVHYNAKSSYEELLYESKVMEEDIMFSKYVEIGHMNLGRWKNIEKYLKILNLVDKNFNIENYIYVSKSSDIFKNKSIKYLSYIILIISIIVLLSFLFILKLNKKVEERTKELKDTISKFTAIFNNNFQFTGILDLDGKVLLVNKASLEIICAKSKDVVGKFFWKTLWFSHSFKEESKIKDSIELVKKKKFMRFETSHKGCNNRYYVIDFSIKVADNENGDITYLIVEGRDITDYKTMEKRIHNSLKMEAIGSLAGGIAHDFNNIISGIMGYTELLKGEDKSSADLDYLEQINSASNRAKSLVSRIVTFSKGVEEKRININLVDLIEGIVSLIRPTIKDFNISINTDIKNIAPIYAVYTQIEQVIMNILKNSVQSIKKDEGRIDVLLDTLETKENRALLGSILPPNKYVLLSISDTGVGIKEKNLDKIFEPYFSTKNKKEGTGLGLFVVDGIMSKHHSYIDVKTELGKGTTFYLYFPISNNSFDKITITKREYLSTSSLYGKRILFVDDEEMITNSISKLLVKKGFIVDPFINSLEAYKNFKNNPDIYDVIITDQSMPNITGIELVSKIKKLNKDVPIILCSGYNNRVNESNMNDYSIDDYLEKPIAIKKLIESISHILSSKN